MRKVCFISIVLFTCLALFGQFAAAEEGPTNGWYVPDDFGFFGFYGTEKAFINSSESHEHSVARIFLCFGKFLDEKKRWKIETELHFGRHDSRPCEAGPESNSDSEYGFNFVGKRYFDVEYKIRPYVGILGGFSCHGNPEDQPNFGNSGYLGTFGGLAGVETPISENAKFRAEYRGTHTSDPLRSHDSGRNYHGFVVGIIFNF